MNLVIGLFVFAAWIVWKIVELLYNAFFHPLCCFPGPPMARMSRWWLFQQEMSGDSHLTIQKMHAIHGRVVRIAPNELSIIDQKANTAIYGQGSKFTKAKYFYRAFENHAGNLFTICDKEAHLQDKRLMANSFSRANILRHVPKMNEKVDHLMARLTEYARAEKPIPLVAAFRCLSIDTITEFCYGQSLGALECDDFHCSQFEAFDIVTPGVPFVCVSSGYDPVDAQQLIPGFQFQHFPFLRQMLRWVSDYELPFVPSGMREMEKGAENGLKTARMLNTKHDKGITMFQDILESAKEKAIKLDDASLVAEGILMNFAGTDSTAATLAIGLYNLCRRPELYLKLQRSLREQTKENGHPLDFLHLEADKLLDACLKESLRVACPVGGRLPREVPAGGWSLDGHHIPAGMIVGSSPFYECYDASSFPDPEEFRPERWLADDVSELLKNYHPFSRGTRQCIGQNLSLIEQRIAFAAFVMKFTPVEIMDKNPRIKSFITIVIDTDMAVKVAIV